MFNASRPINTTCNKNGTLINATTWPDSQSEIFSFSCSYPFQATRDEVYILSPTFIAYSRIIASINCTLPFFAVVANVLPIIVIATRSHLQTKANMIFVNMMCKNMVEALVSQPTYATLILSRVNRQPACFNLLACFLGCMCLAETMCTQTLIAYEQYAAVFSPFDYENRMSNKFLVTVIGATWLLSIFTASGACLFEVLRSSSAILITCLIITANASTIYGHIKICKLLKGMRQVDVENRIGEEREEARVERKRRENRTNNLTFCIIFLPICLYLPTFIRNVLIPAIGYDKWSSYTVNTIMQFHSLISPLFYCYQNPSIARQVKAVIRCGVTTIEPIVDLNN